MSRTSPPQAGKRRHRATRIATLAAALILGGLSARTAGCEEPKSEPELEVGGPLAGLRLPLYRTHHGEPPGYPGGKVFGPPQVELYPGSVEHFRAYAFKWLPCRSLFDRQSQLRNWVAPALPGHGATPDRYAQPTRSHGRQGGHVLTGRLEPPVEVLRARAGDPLLVADLGELPEGLYCVRVIAAVPTEECTQFRKNLYLVFTVDDQNDGAASRYRLRIGYCDLFYSVAELYFHAPRRRTYRVMLEVDPASEVPLLVRNVTLDDVFAGFVRRPLKTRSNEPVAEDRVSRVLDIDAARAEDPDARSVRWARDAELWTSYPRINTRWTMHLRNQQSEIPKSVRADAPGRSAADIEEESGKWVYCGKRPPAPGVFLRNEKLGLSYTFSDLNAGRPLPDPFPVKDDGNGVAAIDPGGDGTTGTCWSAIAEAVHWHRTWYQERAARALEVLGGQGGLPSEQVADAIRDGLICFARNVYDLPSYDNLQELSEISLQTGGWGRDLYDHQRELSAKCYTWYTEYVEFAELYDRYFPLIAGNEDLAASLQRFVPAIRSPEDVVAFFDTYLVQTTARRVLRYHYHVHPTAALELAALLGDPAVTRPWVEWNLSRTFIYPLPPVGLRHLAVSGYDHSGIEYGRSTFYGIGQNTAVMVDAVEDYCRVASDFSLSMNDASRFPKGRAAAYWPLRMFVAGWQYPRIGDVTGPDKTPEMFLTQSRELLSTGWRLTRDPRFAAILHYKSWSSDPEVREAAESVRRMPWFENESRQVQNWAGILEGGTAHDDYRFRRAAMVRVGRGSGHHHEDTLDLQMCAFGLPILTDAGQRPGYTNPASRSSTVHNLVTVARPGQPQAPSYFHSWIASLLDESDTQYLQARAGEPGTLERGCRQVASIAADEGRNAGRLPVERQVPGVELDPDVALPKTYVFDVYRTDGPGRHRYNFHAMVNDAFEWNAEGERPDANVLNGEFKDLGDRSFAAVSPEVLSATWRLRRESSREEAIRGTEEQDLGVDYDPASPAKHVRLHLFDVKGAAAQRGELLARTPCPTRYHFTCVGVEREVGDAGSCFVALIEPYAGEPFIRKARLLPIADGGTGARRAVALSVETTAGTRDFLAADLRDGPERVVAEGRERFRAEFAWRSVDADGLRSAGLVAGTLLDAPEIRIRLAESALSGKITRVSYARREIEIEGAWPALDGPAIVEIGGEEKRDSYTLLEAKPAAQGRTLLTTLEGADRLWAEIESIDEAQRRVRPVVDMVAAPASRGWVVTNARGTRSWRMRDGFVLDGFVLDGPVTASDFEPEGEVRVWDYGPGDEASVATFAAIRRIAPGSFEIRALGGATIELPGAAATLKAPDGSEARIEGREGWIRATIGPEHGARPATLVVR